MSIKTSGVIPPGVGGINTTDPAGAPRHEHHLPGHSHRHDGPVLSRKTSMGSAPKQFFGKLASGAKNVFNHMAASVKRNPTQLVKDAAVGFVTGGPPGAALAVAKDVIKDTAQDALMSPVHSRKGPNLRVDVSPATISSSSSSWSPTSSSSTPSTAASHKHWSDDMLGMMAAQGNMPSRGGSNQSYFSGQPLDGTPYPGKQPRDLGTTVGTAVGTAGQLPAAAQIATNEIKTQTANAVSASSNTANSVPLETGKVGSEATKVGAEAQAATTPAMNDMLHQQQVAFEQQMKFQTESGAMKAIVEMQKETAKAIGKEASGVAAVTGG